MSLPNPACFSVSQFGGGCRAYTRPFLKWSSVKARYSQIPIHVSPFVDPCIYLLEPNHHHPLLFADKCGNSFIEQNVALVTNGKNEENIAQRNTQICFWLVVWEKRALPLESSVLCGLHEAEKEILPSTLLLTFNMRTFGNVKHSLRLESGIY